MVLYRDACPVRRFAFVCIRNHCGQFMDNRGIDDVSQNQQLNEISAKAGQNVSACAARLFFYVIK